MVSIILLNFWLSRSQIGDDEKDPFTYMSIKIWLMVSIVLFDFFYPDPKLEMIQKITCSIFFQMGVAINPPLAI